jgi:hypothetical protein
MSVMPRQVAASQGVPARVVMEMLGHSQISLTLGTYSHVAPELQQEAVDRIGRVLRQQQLLPNCCQKLLPLDLQ